MSHPMLFAVDVEADAGSLYRAITTQEGLASFWTPDCAAEARVGAVARFGFRDAPVDLRFRIDGLEVDRLVRWTCLGDFPDWADTVVTWELSAATEGAGTTVSFRHDGWPATMPEQSHARVGYVWARIVGALKVYAETGMPRPFLG